MTFDETSANNDQGVALSDQAADIGDSAAVSAEAQSESLLADLAAADGMPGNLDLLLDVNLKISVELGRAQLKFRDVLDLTTGSVVELGRQTSEPVDILVNGALLAAGEVVVVDDHFAVRITKLLDRVERLKRVL